MLVVFVQRPEQGNEPNAVLPSDLRGQPDVQVALRADGPFFPLDQAIDSEPALRDCIARALDPPSVRRYRRVRPWLLVGLLPIVALVELERQLASAGVAGIGGRLAGDLLLGTLCVLEIARPLPRHPLACAMALASIAARYAYMVAATCGHTLPLFWLGAAGALFGSAAMVSLMPRPRLVAKEIREHLSLSPTPTLTPPLSPIPQALFAAAALPMALVGARAAGAGLFGTAVVFIVVGGALPSLFRGRFRLRAPKRATALQIADAAFSALATALSLTRLLHYTTNGVGEAVRCAAPRLYDQVVGPLLGAEATEVARQIGGARSRLALACMAVLVVPLVEERLYRHVLQRALRARMSASRAIGASAVLFGLAHLGVYRVAAYQTVLLGIAFGGAYEEAGLLAPLLAHALYNAGQLL